MTFPTIPTVAGGRVLFTNQADTSGTRTFPSLSSLTKNAGDLLIAVITTYQSSTNPQFSSWGGGFTECSDQGSGTTMGIGVAYKWSTGSETGTFTVTQAATVTGHASMCLLSIPLAHQSTPIECGTIANGTTAAADPGSFNPTGWDAEDTLWIAVDANGMTSGTGSWAACGAGTLTNYTDLANSNTTDNSTVGQTEIAVAFRKLNAASEDRGAVGTHDLSNARNSALIIAVRPDLTQALTQSSSFNNSNGLTYTHVVTPGEVALTQSARFDNSNDLSYTHVISQGGANQDLTQSATYGNSPTFYAHTVTPGEVALSQASRFDNANTLNYQHAVTPGAVALTQTATHENASTFYSHIITQDGSDQALTQDGRFDNSNGFYAATITQSATASAAVSGGWGGFPTYRRKTKDEIKQERIRLGILPPDVAKVVVEAVEKVVESRTVANPEIDIAKAEKEARAALKALKKRWMKEYIQLLSLEYARIEQENEDAQIAMMLFEM